MVGHLVSLKWQYVLASFRRSIWALIGLIFAALYAGGMLFGLGSAYVIANSKVPEYGQLGTLLVGAVIALAWAIVPIFFSGLDGTLDESRFVLFPIKPSPAEGPVPRRVRGYPRHRQHHCRAAWRYRVYIAAARAGRVPHLLRARPCEPHGVGSSRQPPGHGVE